MGCSTLSSLCSGTAKIKRDNAVIFIADADNPSKTKDLRPSIPADGSTETLKRYKSHSVDTCSRTYSFILPVPQHRVQTPLICIEHYYTDEQIKSEVTCSDGISRRLYLGGEFDNTGMGDGVRCGKRSSNKCGDNKIDIIDDDVYIAEKGSTDNIALPKKEFAENIAARKAPFDLIDFESFLPVFEIIKEILLSENLTEEASDVK